MVITTLEVLGNQYFNAGYEVLEITDHFDLETEDNIAPSGPLPHGTL